MIRTLIQHLRKRVTGYSQTVVGFILLMQVMLPTFWDLVMGAVIMAVVFGAVKLDELAAWFDKEK